MHTKTRQHNGATITVKTETGAMRINKWLVEGRLFDGRRFDLPAHIVVQWQQFAAALCQSTIDGSLGFEWPSIADNTAVLEAACEAWLNLPGQLVEDWMNDIAEVNIPPNDSDLLPADMLEKKGEPTPA